MNQKLVWVLLLLLLAGCSGKPLYQAKHAHNFNFSGLSSYSLYNRNSDFTEYQNMSDTTRNSIEIAIEKVFDRQGWTFKAPDSADIIVTYHIVNLQSELNLYNRGVKFCRPCLPVKHPQDQPYFSAALPGTLILDLIDVNSNRTMWRGMSRLKINDHDHSIDVHEKVERAVTTLVGTIPR
ncbi:DUF4136 domain-containing protein [Thalassotalea sediminis]|uniref:DUF4136 domain-containing protein n=1 Tax=Thalassotalea sediminis TaxID=1759089 RepID=UPI0025746CA3|nr:DUF4136 domain-containing protein [Thalassotalea sediminis]